MLRNVLRISFSGRETTWSPGELELVPNSIICYCSFGLCIYCLYFCIRDIVQQCTLYKVGRAVGEEEQGGGGLRQVGDDEVVDGGGGGGGCGGVGDGFMVMVATSTAAE